MNTADADRIPQDQELTAADVTEVKAMLIFLGDKDLAAQVFAILEKQSLNGDKAALQNRNACFDGIWYEPDPNGKESEGFRYWTGFCYGIAASLQAVAQ